MMSYERHTKAQLIAELKELQKKLESLRSSGVDDVSVLKGNVKCNDDTDTSCLFSLTQSLMVEIDRDGIIDGYNTAMRDRYQKDNDKLIGTCLWDILPSDISNKRKKLAEQVFQQGKASSIVDIDDNLCTEWTIHPVWDDDGTVIRASVSFIDISTSESIYHERFEYERYLQAILQTTADGFWAVDTKGHILDVNEAYCRMSGYTKDQLLSMTISDLDVKETHTETKKHISNIIANKTDSFETQHKRKDGSIYDVEFSVTFLDRNGGLMICFCRDITDRKKSVQLLKESEESLRQRNQFIETIINNLPIGLAANIISSQEPFYVNRAFETIYGWPKEHLDSIETFFNKLYPDPEYRQKVKERITADILSGDPDRMIWNNFLITCHDGTQKYVKAQNIPLFEQDMMISTVLDVTDRYIAEMSLVESEKTYRTLIEAIPDVVMRFDRDGRHLYVSENVTEVVDILASEFIGKTHKDLNFPEKHCRLWDDAIRQVYDSGIPFETEFSYKGKKGEKIFNWRLIPEVDEQNKITSVLSLSRDVTAQRQAEQNYQMLFNEMIDGFAIHEIICDESGKPVDYRYIDVNPAFENLTGLKREDIKGKTVREILPTIEQYWIDTYGNVAITGEPAFFQNYAEPLGKHYNVTAFQPAPMQFACIFIDITEHKMAEQKLEEFAHKMKSIFLAAPVGIGVVSNRVFQEVNDLFCAMTGYSRDELVGNSARMIYPSEREYEYVGKEKYRMIKENGTGTVETTIKHKDGRLLNILMSSTPLNPDDLTAGVTFTALDITERKKTEQYLRESEERFRLLIESSPMVVLLIQNGIFTYLNPVSIQLLGYSNQEDVIGMNAYDIVAPEFKEMATKRIENISSGINNTAIEIRLLRADGSDFWVLTRSVLLTIDNIDTVVIIGQDITELKAAERERDKIQDQLTQAQKMEAVGRLAGGVAHDFNNMLNVILGNTEIAMIGLDQNNPLLEELQEIKKASERSADLTRQLLAFARKQTITPQVLDLNETIEGMHKILHRLIGENIELIWIPEKNLWTITMDPSQVDQILANLCVNSRDAITDVGKIIIETHNTIIDNEYCDNNTGSNPGEYVMISVSDTGHGMDETTRANAFEPFFTTKKSDKGTGLGLATVYGIIKQNNGFINIYSEQGQGTTIKLFIPRHIGKTDLVSGIKTEETVNNGHETILLVEDELSLLRLGRRILEGYGYHVLAAGSPTEAIHLASGYSGKIDLLITDVVMPEMDGRAMSKRIITMHPETKCLFMSGYTANVIAHRGVLDKGVHFIQKPYSSQSLAAKVREALETE